uniref:Uncharacterized protein n=1 Tax=Anguilla anguilla TaxID=7936 RepID=A0A0E9P8I1_ANGAN
MALASLIKTLNMNMLGGNPAQLQDTPKTSLLNNRGDTCRK